MTLILRGGALLDRSRVDVAIEEESIAAVGREVAKAGDEIDARWMTILPGLHDHHIHIMATAARRRSVDLTGITDEEAAIARIRAAPGQGPVRAVSYDERVAGLPDRAVLDRWLPDRPLRVQDRTGALWVLNTLALQGLPDAMPRGAEYGEDNRPNGRLWREDRWLASQIAAQDLDLASLGRELASCGLTGLTDAGPGNGPREAAILGEAARNGDIPQRLTLMGDETLPAGRNYTRGPLKLMIDERDPPDLDVLAERIVGARAQRRNVAAHCATAAELAIYLAALETSGGAKPGDRVEHGGVMDDAALDVLKTLPVTVVTNPAFIHDRGDRYRAAVPRQDLPWLYRAASLGAAMIPLAAGSDAPYASTDPWLGMRAARDRLTAAGLPLGADQRIPATRALALYQGRADDPGGAVRTIAPGQPADLILCLGTPEEVVADLDRDRVEMTMVGGCVVWARNRI